MSQAVLERPTLVLNRNWQPVNVATVARSLTMLWNETAKVVDPEDFRLYSWSDWARLEPREGEPMIRAVTFRLRVPEVITLTRYDRYREAAVTFSRRNILKRDHATCQYCGVQPGSEELTIDHVVPRSLGGTTTWENCVLACVACNAKKANRTPERANMALRRKPFRPSWKPMYSGPTTRIESWSRFLSEAYWNVPMEEPAPPPHPHPVRHSHRHEHGRERC
jgi:5-methylcytosine-specific restriction endonuclease McrA